MAFVVSVALEKAAPAYDREYDYLVSDGLGVVPGCRLLVPFGNGNRARVGMALSIRAEEAPNPRCKTVLRLLDDEPLLDSEGLELLRLLKATTFCTWSDAMHALIPPGAGLRLSSGLSAVRDACPERLEALSPDARRLYDHLLPRKAMTDEQKALAAVGLIPGHPAAQELVDAGLAVREQLVRKRIVDERAVMARLIEPETPSRLTPKQQSVADLLGQIGCASVRELCYFTGVGRSVLDRMRKLGCLELFEEIVVRPEPVDPPTDPADILLSPSQQRAFDALCRTGDGGTFEISLLHGVTGSGKTQVFLKLIERTLAQGKTAMVLIPEIALTPQTVRLFSARFGSAVAVLHSSLSMTERLDAWRRIRAGKAPIVVGTRSAVFAPLSNLGLIVIDEEQEHTYHSESAPRYHARDIAKYRARRHGAQLLLCSATPSVESYEHAVRGRYHLVELPERFSGGALPEVVTVDLHEAPLAAGSAILSEPLCEELLTNLTRGEQSILLLNRRGYSTLMLCSACGEAARCPNCSIPMVYHAANHRLQCHYCGHSQPEASRCPTCGSSLLRQTGVGTQRAEEELKSLFPAARILRMDADTTMSRFAHQRGFDAFARGDYDIMIGTQMVAKGLDFPNVTLVGVLSADQALYADDFRGFERTFSLITQVVGRGGRSALPGRAIIQTFSPDNHVLALAAAQDYKSFFSEEIAYRRVGLYPPFCDIACVMFSCEDEQAAADDARWFLAALTQAAARDCPALPMRVLGPAECRPYRVAGRYRCRLLLKCRNSRPTRALLGAVSADYHAGRHRSIMAIDLYYDSNV